jgi:hypothetical protein
VSRITTKATDPKTTGRETQKWRTNVPAVRLCVVASAMFLGPRNLRPMSLSQPEMQNERRGGRALTGSIIALPASSLTESEGAIEGERRQIALIDL